MLGRLALGGVAIIAGWTAYRLFVFDDALIFAQPAGEAVARLGDADRVVEGTGMGSLMILPGETLGDETQGGDVAIFVRRAGDSHPVRCHVTVSSISETSSRAAVDCKQPGFERGGAQEVATQAITLVMREHVAATVDKRDYDIDSVANAMLTLVAVNGPKLAGVLQDEQQSGDPE